MTGTCVYLQGWGGGPSTGQGVNRDKQVEYMCVQRSAWLQEAWSLWEEWGLACFHLRSGPTPLLGLSQMSGLGEDWLRSLREDKSFLSVSVTHSQMQWVDSYLYDLGQDTMRSSSRLTMRGHGFPDPNSLGGVRPPGMTFTGPRVRSWHPVGPLYGRGRGFCVILGRDLWEPQGNLRAWGHINWSDIQNGWGYRPPDEEWWLSPRTTL